MLRTARRFLDERGVLEVDTPVLARTVATDPDIDALSVVCPGNTAAGLDASRRESPDAVCSDAVRSGADLAVVDRAAVEYSAGVAARRLYLQTSPEHAMKRLLAAGSGPIYQLGKVFRAGECGRWHNIEFTMLEWYRPGLSLNDLMLEVAQLIECVTGRADDALHDYGTVFEQATGLDPHRASDEALVQAVRDQTSLDDGMAASLGRRGCIDLLFGQRVQPSLAGVAFVCDYPASHAALARLESDAISVARRFEVFIDGVEIGNGYHELDDATEQAERMKADIAERFERGLEAVPVDDRLLAALGAGLGDVCGVAVGFDRLVAIATDSTSIADVMPFTTEFA